VCVDFGIVPVLVCNKRIACWQHAHFLVATLLIAIHNGCNVNPPAIFTFPLDVSMSPQDFLLSCRSCLRSDSRCLCSLSAPMLAVAGNRYALSPIDLIPDFIPVLGCLDDLVILPCLIWLAVRLMPPVVWEGAKRRAIQEPLQLSKNKVAAMMVIGIWMLTVTAVWWLWFSSAAKQVDQSPNRPYGHLNSIPTVAAA
jgi:uncharacterized membrane protein YkvA (DUF1232 family)